jgi:hypothetical protein
MKRLIIILTLAIVGTRAQAAKLDPKDAKLIKGTAIHMTVVKRCRIVQPTKAAANYKILYAVMDRKMFTAALAEADADVSELIRKLGEEKFCVIWQQRLEKTWRAIPDDPFR